MKHGNTRTADAKRTTILAIALIAFAAFAGSSLAAESVEDIVAKTEENQIYTTAKTDVKLAVTNKFGVTQNEFTTYSRKGGDVLIAITSGPDKGQKVLRLKQNVYLYYPDAEEVIWLKGSALKDSMMGSDFSYEDLTNDKTILGRYSVESLGTETVDGAECAHVMLTAKTRNETYAKQELWIDAKAYVTRKGILYSASGKPIREMYASDVRTVSGKNVAFKTAMRDLLKKNSSTEMSIVSIEIGIPLAEKYFNREELSW
jgi:outer membrane lipoprotein-sorting protein